MSFSRIYQQTDLAVHQSVVLNEAASHHLARVLRVAVGEHLVLFNGLGGEYTAVITHISKKHVTVEITAFEKHCRESAVKIHLAQGIARGEKMDFIIQKAVELGVATISPLVTERCNVRLDKERELKRLMHWRSIVISACEQSGRNTLPDIVAPQTLSAWLPTVSSERRLVLNPHSHAPLSREQPCQSVTLLIGPEGGLSVAEVEAAQSAGFESIQLGPRVLRTETASLAALAAIQCAYGDFF